MRSGTPLLGQSWVRLAKGAKATAKHGSSGREWTLHGPAEVLPCPRGAEIVLLASGKLTTSRGMGARPGAETIVATPLGAVIASDAQVELLVSARSARLRVVAGAASVTAAPWAKLLGKTTVRPGAAATLTPREGAERDAADHCRNAAKKASNAARAVVDSQRGQVGKNTATHVEARRSARIACAVALAEHGPFEPGVVPGSWRQLLTADALWRAPPGKRLPAPSRAPKTQESP